MKRLAFIASLAESLLFYSYVAGAQGFIDVEIVEATPGVRLTVDVAWSPEFGVSSYEFDYSGTAWVRVDDWEGGGSFRLVLVEDGGDPDVSISPTFLLLPGRDWGVEGSGAWRDGWWSGPGIYASLPGVFHLDGDFPGMRSNPPQFTQTYPNLDVYGARFVFGTPYPVDQPPGGEIPEASTWLAFVPVGLAAGWAVRRRRSLQK